MDAEGVGDMVDLVSNMRLASESKVIRRVSVVVHLKGKLLAKTTNHHHFIQHSITPF